MSLYDKLLMINAVKNMFAFMTTRRNLPKLDKSFLMDHFAMIDMKRLAESTFSSADELKFIIHSIIELIQQHPLTFPTELIRNRPNSARLEDFMNTTMLDKINLLQSGTEQLLKSIDNIHVSIETEKSKESLVMCFESLFQTIYELLVNGLNNIPMPSVSVASSYKKGSVADRVYFLLSFVDFNRTQLEMNMVLCKFYAQGSGNWVSVQDSANSALLNVVLFNLDQGINYMQTKSDSNDPWEKFRYRIFVIKKLISIKENDYHIPTNNSSLNMQYTSSNVNFHLDYNDPASDLSFTENTENVNDYVIPNSVQQCFHQRLDLERFKDVWQMTSEVLYTFLNETKGENAWYLDNLWQDYTLCLRYKMADCPTLNVMYEILDSREKTFQSIKKVTVQSK